MKTLYVSDLDGTLLDTLGGLADTTNAVMQQFNFPMHSLESYKIFIGNGLKKLIERSVPMGTSSTIPFLKIYLSLTN